MPADTSTTPDPVAAAFFAPGDRVQVHAPGHPQLDDGWHAGTVVESHTQQADATGGRAGTVMVTVRFEDPDHGSHQVAGPYVRQAPGTCRHCRRSVTVRAGLTVTHDWPVPFRQVCPGSQQAPRADVSPT